MKKLLIYTFLFLSFFLSVNSYAEWIKMSTNVDGTSLYLDKRTVKIVGDIRFFLYMQDYAKPTQYGDLSSRSYAELNCNNMMSRDLIKDYFSLPLAEGEPTEGSGAIKNPEWRYFKPNSTGGILRIKVCEMKN